MTKTIEIEYQQQIEHLLGTINSQRRLIEALRADYQLIQVIVSNAVSGQNNKSSPTPESQD